MYDDGESVFFEKDGGCLAADLTAGLQQVGLAVGAEVEEDTVGLCCRGNVALYYGQAVDLVAKLWWDPKQTRLLRIGVVTASLVYMVTQC